MKLWWIWRHELYEEYVWSYEECEDMNCMKNMYEVMMNMKRGIVWKICMMFWWIWRLELYEEYVWSFDVYDDMSCIKNMYEVMKNMKTGFIWRICMKLL